MRRPSLGPKSRRSHSHFETEVQFFATEFRYVCMRFFFVLILAYFSLNTASAQQVPNKKLDLGDIAIKGELLSDDRMNFVRRQREELRNRVKFRTNFRSEILQEYKN